MNVKKILIIILVNIAIITASFFSGYTYSSIRFDDNIIDEYTALIKEQGITIKNLEGSLREAIEESSIIIEEGGIIKDELDELGNDIGNIETGLREDINGISGVIDLLEYYKRQGNILEKGNSN